MEELKKDVELRLFLNWIESLKYGKCILESSWIFCSKTGTKPDVLPCENSSISCMYLTFFILVCTKCFYSVNMPLSLAFHITQKVRNQTMRNLPWHYNDSMPVPKKIDVSKTKCICCILGVICTDWKAVCLLVKYWLCITIWWQDLKCYAVTAVFCTSPF